MKIAIKDETFAGEVLNEILLEFETQLVTVSDIIEARVRKEVDTYNQKLTGFFNGLVQPTETEQTLNGYKMKPKKTIDAEKQVYTALDAFQKNGYFLLIDSQQSTDLEQTVQLSKNTTVSFVKLTPLVGG